MANRLESEPPVHAFVHVKIRVKSRHATAVRPLGLDQCRGALSRIIAAAVKPSGPWLSWHRRGRPILRVTRRAPS